MRILNLVAINGVVFLAIGCFVDDPGAATGNADGAETSTANGTTSSSLPTTGNPSTSNSATSTDGSTGVAVDESDSTAETATTEVDTGSTETGVASTTGLPEGCSDAEMCVPPAEFSWSGPVALRIAPGNVEPACPLGWAAGELHFMGLNVPGVDCACDCGDAVGTGSCDYNLALFSGTACSDAIQSAVYPGPAFCDPGLRPPYSAHATTQILNTSCSAGIIDSSIQPPPPSWNANILECRPPAASPTCADGLCWPPVGSLEEGLCIWRNGEHDCDVGAFTEQRIAYADMQGDPPTCAADSCECDIAEAVCVGGDLQVFNDASCSDATGSAVSIGQCLDVAAAGLSVGVQSSPSQPSVTCGDTTVPTSHTLAPTMPRTYCCI